MVGLSIVVLSVFALAPEPTTGQTSSTATATCRLLRDTLIRQKTPTTTYDAYPKGWAHSAVEGIAGSWIEALLRFDLSACLPAGAQISSAALRVYVTNPSAYRFEVYEMLRSFSAAASWNVYAASLPWAQPGAMGGADYGARLATIAPTSTTGALSVPLAATVVQGWAGSASRSIVVRPTGTPGTNNAPVGLGFRSKEHPDGSPPVLTVVYATTAAAADTTPPVIANISVTPETTRATLRWTTDEPASGRVSYGPTTAYGATTPLSAAGLTDHRHTLTGLVPSQRYYYRIASTDAAGNTRTSTGDFFTVADSSPGAFKIVAWNMHYGKGMTAKAPGMACPLPGLKDNAQCQVADNPATPIDERYEERRQSAWGVGLTQRYLNGPMVLGDPEVVALLLTEVNGGTCFSQQDLMAEVRRVWPRAAISRPHRDNWIVARWGFVQGTPHYAERDLPPCGYKGYASDGSLVAWPAGYAEGIEWGRIHAEDPDPDGDGVLKPNPRIVNVFNAHWPGTGMTADGTRFFCRSTTTATRDFMNAPAAGVSLASEPVILGGDLNYEDVVRPYETSSCEPYGAKEEYDLLRAAGFADAFAAGTAARLTPTADGSTGMIGRASTETCYKSYSHNGLYMPYKRIDFQWFRGGTAPGTNLRVLEFELIGVEQFGNCVPSDHMGTKVRYAWY